MKESAPTDVAIPVLINKEPCEFGPLEDSLLGCIKQVQDLSFCRSQAGSFHLRPRHRRVRNFLRGYGVTTLHWHLLMYRYIRR